MPIRPLAIAAVFALFAPLAFAQAAVTQATPASPATSAPATTPSAEPTLAPASESRPATTAAPPSAGSDPREYTEASRKAYAKGLKDARGLIAERQYKEAIVILDKLSVERPREPQARFLKGVALADSGKSDEAIAAFVAVLADYPELPEPHNNLAVLYGQKGNYAQARDELEMALRAAPDYGIAYENLGDVYARLAAVNYESAIAREPRNKTAPPKLKLVRDVLGLRILTTGEQMGPPAPVPATETPK
jgi:tetratricopeptide (TPR) repeat protein